MPGVGDVTVFGTANYSMRVWLDPEKLKARGLTTQDVVAAIREQNVQVAAGQIGQPPLPTNKTDRVSIHGHDAGPAERRRAVREHHRQDRRRQPDHAAQGRRPVELGAQTYDQFNLKQGIPTANIGIFQLPGSNALEVAESVRDGHRRDEQHRFPKGMSYEFPLDTTKFVEASIHAVYETLIEAGVLVLLVILVFLQDWRAVLVPATTVPVTIIGAFFAMCAAGLLGQHAHAVRPGAGDRHRGRRRDRGRRERGAPHRARASTPKPATIQAMSEVLGPIIGITLVLMSVFLPSAFLGGITGQLYQQFALTIAATALHQRDQRRHAQAGPVRALAAAAQSSGRTSSRRAFNRVYGWFERVYVGDRAPAGAASSPLMMLAVRRPDRADGLVVSAAADRLPADRRPGLHASSACNCPTRPRRRGPAP